MSKVFLLILWPWYFKKRDWFRYELDQFIKDSNVSLEIHELGKIIIPGLIKPINHERNKYIKTFNNFLDWSKRINLLSKKKIFIINDVTSFNFKSYLIRKEIYNLKKINKINIVEFSKIDCPVPKKITLFKNLFKNIIFIIFRPKKIFIFFRTKIFLFLDKKNSLFIDIFIKANAQKIFNNKKNKNIKIIEGSSFDYSNNLLFKKNNKNIIINNKFAIYLDSPFPESADSNIFALNFPFDVNKWSLSLNVFFLRIEKMLNLNILIAPHPKNNLNKMSNYYGKRKIITEPLAAFSKRSELFITRNSTAISYAVMNYKPIFLIYSDEQNNILNFQDKILYDVFAKELSLKPINIDKEIDENFIKNNLKVNYKRYNSYKYKFLTNKGANQPNSKLLLDLLKVN